MDQFAFPVYLSHVCTPVVLLCANTTSLPDPIEMLSPVYQGLTCQPTNDTDAKCTMGGYPLYVINATNVAQVQLGINFARETGIRLVVKNTGHDFSGKSGGGGSLSIWTHNLKDAKYIENYEAEGTEWTGAAFKLGSGVQAYEIYKTAAEQGLMVVGGEGQVCRSQPLMLSHTN